MHVLIVVGSKEFIWLSWNVCAGEIPFLYVKPVDIRIVFLALTEYNNFFFSKTKKIKNYNRLKAVETESDILYFS